MTATTSVQQLQEVYRELDYLDDGYEDGLVSHVGLRRIILETPELEAELGSTLTRALLAKAERNIYGRLTLEEFLLMARDVVSVYNSSSGGSRSNVGSMRSFASGGGTMVGPYYVDPSPGDPSATMRSAVQEAQQDPSPCYYSEGQHLRGGPKNTINKAAVRLAIPVSEREERLRYLDQYSCMPPPIFLILISLAQLGVYVWHVITLVNLGYKVGPDGPPYVDNLIFDPNRKYEVWRFLSYMFVHSGYFHLAFNLLVQLILGIPLEMVHRWWRIMLIYLCGVVAGSLATSITDPSVYLAGASGGVYALLAAHLANVVFNWSEMELAALRLAALILLATIDTGVAVYYRYIAMVDTRVSYVAHLAGAFSGLLLGIVILRNLRVLRWERVVWWISLLLFLGLFLAAIIKNAVTIGLEQT